MSASHLFQDFGTSKAQKPSTPGLAVEEVEEQKLDAFEKGYQAGWEDAVKAQNDTLTHVSSGLAASLQAASFEYHELRASLSSSVQSIMSQVVETILPTIAHASLGAHIREQIAAVSKDALDRPIEIAVSAESEDAVLAALSEGVPEPFELVIDPLMSSTQVILRVGPNETEINLDRVVADIGAAITTYFETQK